MIMRWFGRTILRLFGWRVTGRPPALDKYIVIVAPHTSNWDFLIGLMAKFAFGVRLRFLGKHSLFAWYSGWFFRMFGGIPVRRDKAHNVVKQVTEFFEKEPTLILALAPEGTRSYTDHWRSGFYRIAKAAKVPIVLAFLDAQRKEVGLGPMLLPSEDIQGDMELIRRFYADKVGIRPELKSRVRLLAEDETG